MLGLESIAAGGVRQLRDKQTHAEEQHDDDAQNDQQQLARDQTRDQTPIIAAPSLPSPDHTTDSSITTASAPVSAVSLSASNAAALDQVRRTATCGICSNLVASSLVLSCGHMFCGSCLFDFLNDKPSCPTCQVSLRAIPVRCLALDGVVEALCRVLTKTELDTYHVRVEEGKSVANKLNKMFWWLQPAAIPALGDAHMQHQTIPGGSNAVGAAAAAMSGGGSAAGSRVRGGSCGGAAASSCTSRHMQPRQSLDSHLACAPQLSHMSQAHLNNNQMLPGLLGCSPVGPASHLSYDDMPHQHSGFGHSLAMGSHQPLHQAQAQRQAQAAGYGVPRAPRHQLSQSFNQAVGMQQQQQVHGGMQGMDSPSLCNMAALGLTHSLQQHGMGQQLPSSFFDYSSAPAQQQCTPQMQQMPEYPQSVQASSQSEQMANLHAHVQLQNLLRSLSIGDWS